jgi:hypothetical protein
MRLDIFDNESDIRLYVHMIKTRFVGQSKVSRLKELP